VWRACDWRSTAAGTPTAKRGHYGAHQVTFSGKPLYTFTSDKKPLQVLCNGVDGWYVVRVH